MNEPLTDWLTESPSEHLPRSVAPTRSHFFYKKLLKNVYMPFCIPALGLFKGENAAQIFLFFCNLSESVIIHIFMDTDWEGRYDFIYDCQCNKNIETHAICQTDKKDYSSKVKSATQRFHSLPMNIVKIIVPSIAYFFLLFLWHDNYLFTQGVYVYTLSTHRLAQCGCHK